MSLHAEVTGQGAPLVMLHGWGMHGGIWGDAVAQLAQSFTVHNIDLPGHGMSVGRVSTRHEEDAGMNPDLQLEGIVDTLAAQFSESVAVCGWSLGGLIAQRWAAREPEKIKRLVLVASTPCFAARDDWPCGVPLATLQQFAAELEKNHGAALRRFLALQLRGSENERELLSLLREKLFSRGGPDRDALRGGLAILRDTDLRPLLPGIEQPTLVIAGERDKLTPPQASRYMAQAMPKACVVEIAGAAHVPFLSHTDVFVETVSRFLKEKDD